MVANSIKNRIELADDSSALVRLLITHPMLIDRIDKETGKPLKPHFIEEVTVSLNGNIALVMDWGQGVSANPYVTFTLKGVKSGDIFQVKWRDNNGESDTAKFPVP